MREEFIRSALLLGEDGIEKLAKKRVAIFGVGGVGGFCAEALARTGIGYIDLIDNDVVSVSNLNRQIVAKRSTLGLPKVDVMKKRIMDINDSCIVNTYKVFYLEETKEIFDFTRYDYIIDAIDTVSAKLSLVIRANETKTKIISSMGAGNKLNPTEFEVSDISKTSICPLAKVMRRELKKRGIKKLKVVYSKENARKPFDLIKEEDRDTQKRSIPGSVAFVPSVVGLIIASEVIKDLLND